uniref:Uncharacterized protein n=1 Tax=Anguilla anguilla TaxID=7936 RepID=A0A0E9VP20_ANGAN
MLVHTHQRALLLILTLQMLLQAFCIIASL